MVKLPDKQLVYYVRKMEFANNKNGNAKEFEALNKEFIENVFYKNDLLCAFYSYQHAWGSKGGEYVEVSVFDSLSDMVKANEKEDALVKQHWPDDVKGKEFGKKLGAYFKNTHGDFLYRNEVGLQK